MDGRVGEVGREENKHIGELEHGDGWREQVRENVMPVGRNEIMKICFSLQHRHPLPPCFSTVLHFLLHLLSSVLPNLQA